MTDHELLQAYTLEGSQAAFTELVERHLPLVWSTARRQVRDDHLTQDVAQQVFTLLARKAPDLGPEVIVPGWLYRTTSHLAARLQRGESRRREREHVATTAMNEPTANSAWMEVEPLLDEAMASLNDTDRDAVVLRYFKNQSLREVGAALGSSEDAAQKRLSRAVEKLHAFFSRRGKTVTAGAFVAALAGSAVHPAPAGLATVISTAALSGAAITTAAGTPTAALTTLKLMSAAALKPILITSAVLAVSTVIVVQNNRAGQLRNENEALQDRVRKAEATSAELAQQLQSASRDRDNDAARSELLRLRAEVSRLRAAEAELARQQQSAQQRQADVQRQGVSSVEEKRKYDEQRITTVDAFKHIGLQLRILANENRARAAYQADGTLRSDLIAQTHPGFDLAQVEILVTDPERLGELTDKFPETIVTRTRDPIPTPDGRWLRIYGCADGSAHQFTFDNPNQTFGGQWKLQRAEPSRR
jgi:RNA polymerase sigma factor (sigma-70 family)